MAVSFALLIIRTLHKPNALVKQFNFHFNLDILLEQVKELWTIYKKKIIKKDE